MEESKEEAAKLEYLHDVYLKEYENIVNTLSTYGSIANAAEMSKAVLENMQKLKDKKLMLNLGSGLYANVTMANDDKIVAYVGAGYFVEKDVDEAKHFLEEYSQRNKKIIDQLSSDKKRFEDEIFDIEYKLSLLEQE